MTYLFIKWLHIISSTVLFGTGLGTAFQMYAAHRSGDVAAIAVVSRNTVLADWLFTLTSGIVQPVTGLLLVYIGGWDPSSRWLLASYLLYLIALGCWLPVVRLQIQIRQLARDAVGRQEALPPAYFKAMRRWFLLGWPAFIALLLVFWLMVVKL